MKTWIINGKVFDADTRSFTAKSILFQNQTITAITDEVPDSSDQVIDAQDGYVLPGFIDIHAHLREPGGEDKETVLSGTLAAAKGGYTTLLAMPNTQPPMDNESILHTLVESIKKHSVIDVIPSGCITSGQQGKSFSELFSKGLLSFYTDDGKGLENSKLFLEAVKHAKNNHLHLLLHEEDSQLSGNGVVHEGYLSQTYGLPGIPYASESAILARDLVIANSEQYAVHFTHLSAQQSLDFLECARNKSLLFTCDTTPHHVFFDEEAVDINNTSFKVNPPLRSRQDRMAIIKGIQSGLIDCIGTDHAPHVAIEKKRGFLLAPFGISGIETSFAVLYTALVLPGYLSLEDLIPLLTSKPAMILGLKDRGKLAPGYLADITLIKLEKRIFSEADLISKGKNCPYIGFSLTGWPTKTIHHGQLIYETNN